MLRNCYQNIVLIPRWTWEDVGDVAETDCAAVSGAAGDSHAPLLPILVLKMKVIVAQSSPTLYYPMDWSPPGSSVHGILQARVLERVAIPSSRDLPNPDIEPVSPASPALQEDSLLPSHWGSRCRSTV